MILKINLFHILYVKEDIYYYVWFMKNKDFKPSNIIQVITVIMCYSLL